MIVSGIEIDEREAVAYMTREWAEGRGVHSQWIRDVLWPEVAALPDRQLDMTGHSRHWLAAEAQRRLCQWYRKRGACKYDRARGRWVPA
jgi:hypothetical protein